MWPLPELVGVVKNYCQQFFLFILSSCTSQTLHAYPSSYYTSVYMLKNVEKVFVTCIKCNKLAGGFSLLKYPAIFVTYMLTLWWSHKKIIKVCRFFEIFLDLYVCVYLLSWTNPISNLSTTGRWEKNVLYRDFTWCCLLLSEGFSWLVTSSIASEMPFHDLDNQGQVNPTHTCLSSH